MLVALFQNNVLTALYQPSSDAEYQNVAALFQAAIDVTDLYPQPIIGCLLNGNSIVNPDNTNMINWHITKLKFRLRFTNSEITAVFQAASTNFTLAALLDNQSVSTYTDLSDPTLIQGIEYMVSLGLLTQLRATAILTTPPTPLEQYNG